MDRQWYEMAEDEIDASAEARKARTFAYYNTFYGTDDGRVVLMDIARMCYDTTRRNPCTSEGALGIVALVELLYDIKVRCGLTDEKATIEAEARAVILGDDNG